jgi:beta-lactamase class A
LMNNIALAEFTKTFTDLGLSKDLVNSDAAISAHDYSLFWLALYNGSYLNFDNSDYALSLLSECDFTEGLVKGIPQNIKVAHKFGEKGDAMNHAFHETGIVYINNNPYLITVMTQGKDQTKLPNVLKEISAVVYQNMDGITK